MTIDECIALAESEDDEWPSTGSTT
jgi:hypothetical protein